jgi:hypothetical protein
VRISVALVVAAAAACASAGAQPRPNPIGLRLDYSAAEALLTAIERTELSDADVDSLLRVPGVRAMVDNVTRFVPSVGVTHFRDEVKTFARRKRGTRQGGAFQLSDVWRNRQGTRFALQELRAREQDVMRSALARLNRYRLDTGPLTIRASFVVGGVSDGFVFDDRAEPAFYINLTRSNDDIDGLVENIAHETYHVMQKAAQRRVRGLAVFADSSERQPPPLRLLTVTLAEGLANYVVNPQRSSGTGAQIDASRERYRRNAMPARITENFALFDRVLRDLRAQRLSWEQAYEQGFSGNNDARFYFVGFQMAKAIEQHCGAACIARLFEQPPVEFFRQYIALYKRHPDIPGRFAPETEAFVSASDRR